MPLARRSCLAPWVLTFLLLLGLSGCAGIAPRPDLIKGGWQTPQSVYDGGG